MVSIRQVLLALLVAFTAIVSACSWRTNPDATQCGQNCLDSALNTVSCKPTCDADGIPTDGGAVCLCESATYLAAVAKCIYRACGGSDALGDSAYLEQSQCESVGATPALSMQQFIDAGVSGGSSASASTPASSSSSVNPSNNPNTTNGPSATSASSNSKTADQNDNGLDTGTIIGIVVAIVFGVITSGLTIIQILHNQNKTDMNPYGFVLRHLTPQQTSNESHELAYKHRVVDHNGQHSTGRDDYE